MTTIHEHSKVTLHFSLTLPDGEVVDSNFDTQPATLVIGDGNLPEGFEHHLLGLSAGDKRSVEVAPENAFGQHNSQNVQLFKREQFAQASLVEPGMVMSFQDAAGNELPGVIKRVDQEQVEVDFNHPLAGKTLTFTVEIIAVEVADGH